MVTREPSNKGDSMKKLVGVSDVNLGAEIYTGDTKSKLVETSEADFSKCPKCGSSDIEYDVNGIEPEALFVYRVHQCLGCWKKWEERYDLVQVRILGEDDEEKE
jgi:DNA-directed RNA polymerase subunit RPC12/RpoP